MMLRKFHHFFWVVVCLIGNVSQLYWISSQYFRYDISTNVQLLTPDRIDLPHVTICFDLQYAIKWSAMSREERISVLRMDGENIYHQLDPEENITLADIEKAISDGSVFDRSFLLTRLQTTFNTSGLFQKTLSPSDTFKQVFLYNPIKKNIDAVSDNILDIKVFMRDNQKCFLFDVKKHFWMTNLSYSAIRKQSIYSKNMIRSYRIDEEIAGMLNDANYILSAAGHSSRLDLNAFLRIQIKSRVAYSLTYNEYRSTLLPPPYATKCRNYSREGLVSKGGCYETCLRQLSLKKMGSLHPSLAIFPDETEKTTHFMTMLAGKFGADKIDLPQQVDNTCSEECGSRDCSTVLYAPRFLTSLRTDVPPGIAQFISLTPVIKADCLEQISLIQFLTDIASSLGFWLGVSAIGTANVIVYSLGGCKSTNYLKGHRSFLGWRPSHRKTGGRTRSEYLKRKLCELDKRTKLQIDLLLIQVENLKRDNQVLYEMVIK